jgi:hypothetical protein
MALVHQRSVKTSKTPFRRPTELLIPLAITIAITAIAQRWSGLDTPDSSFYATLALFGDEVTDRAPFTSYYWTRLGYIAPVGLLTSLLGAFPGFLAYKFLLTTAITVSAYVITRRHTSTWIAAWLTTGVITSTVILSYLGNSYLTGSVLAGTAILIALATSNKHPLASAALAGTTMGWLVMVNPPGALLAGTLWLVLAIHTYKTNSDVPFTKQFTVATATTIGAFAAFLAIGRFIFPEMNWFEVYLDAQQITLSNFSSTTAVWLQDISLLVPAAVLVITIVNYFTHKTKTAAQQALIISSASVAFMLVFNPMMGGIALEAPIYQSMLWPPALIALVLTASTRMADNVSSSRIPQLVAVLGVIAMIAAGFVAPALPLTVGAGLAVVLIGVVIFTPKTTTATIITIATFLAGAQLLQNSRDDLGLYYLSPYHWAYASNPIETKIRTAVNSQEWLMANTNRDDQILLWVDGPWTQGDRELYVAAGMQLWGENRVTLDPTLTDEYGINQLNTVKPDVLALYGKNMDSVMTFWNSIPKANDPTAPICYDYTWPPDTSSDFPATQGHTCLTQLKW